MSATSNMDEIFKDAVQSRGADYLKAEAALLTGGAPAAAVLQANLKGKSRAVQLLARTLLAWQSGKAPEYQKAIELIDAKEAEAAVSPRGSPSPTGLARALAKTFGPKAVDVLAVRLMKELGWPAWKVLGVLRYLEEQGPLEAAPAVVRFAAQTLEDDLRRAAVRVLGKVPPAELVECLREEQVYLEGRLRELPPELEALMGKPPAPAPVPPGKP
jgi:MoxR-like ATPase